MGAQPNKSIQDSRQFCSVRVCGKKLVSAFQRVLGSRIQIIEGGGSLSCCLWSWTTMFACSFQTRPSQTLWKPPSKINKLLNKHISNNICAYMKNNQLNLKYAFLCFFVCLFLLHKGYRVQLNDQSGKFCLWPLLGKFKSQNVLPQSPAQPDITSATPCSHLSPWA